MSILEESCSRHFRYGDLIQCGETWQRLSEATPFENLPREDATFDALRQIARAVLDPVVDHFGPVQLTYGFASPQLTRKIASRIAPALDQHAGHERNRRGRRVCERGGQAVDLIVPGVSSLVLTEFILAKTPYDRAYFYGFDRPVHVSVCQSRTQQVVLMQTSSGRLVPRVVSAADFSQIARARFAVASGSPEE
jgi:hypothetical protein